ncbi:hydroxyacylglutathione hydrolase [Aureococcus anophagefferens]|uniref:Hydroxyacylglutathione hydrolase n=1 Tax=Aureococcus anophagefferens TaxID=44056 RepID=A0ABR1GGA0_AURAN
MLRRQLLALFWHEPLSVAMVKSRRVFSWAKNIMPALNKALPPALKRRVLREHATTRSRGASRRQAPLRALDCTVDRVVITHRHFDHTGGIAQIRDMLPGVTGYDGALVDGERIVVDDETTLRVWHTPGHCEDHACFLLEEERAIFSATTCSALARPADSTSRASEESQKLQANLLWRFQDSSSAYLAVSFGRSATAAAPAASATGHAPAGAGFASAAMGMLGAGARGHGPPSADPAAKIREYVDHRGAREGQVRAALDDAGRTSLEIVLAIYPKLPPYLTFAAQHTSSRASRSARGRRRREPALRPVGARRAA